MSLVSVAYGPRGESNMVDGCDSSPMYVSAPPCCSWIVSTPPIPAKMPVELAAGLWVIPSRDTDMGSIVSHDLDRWEVLGKWESFGKFWEVQRRGEESRGEGCVENRTVSVCFFLPVSFKYTNMFEWINKMDSLCPVHINHKKEWSHPFLG